MSAFTIAAVSATFRSTIRGSRQEAGDLQRFTLGLVFEDETEWQALLSMVTTKYHVHSPIGGGIVLDIVRGPGQGDLDIDGLGASTAVLVSLDRPMYLPETRSGGTAVFLITGDPI